MAKRHSQQKSTTDFDGIVYFLYIKFKDLRNAEKILQNEGTYYEENEENSMKKFKNGVVLNVFVEEPRDKVAVYEIVSMKLGKDVTYFFEDEM